MKNKILKYLKQKLKDTEEREILGYDEEYTEAENFKDGEVHMLEEIIGEIEREEF